MIKPTIGRVVWFQPACAIDQPLRTQPYPALICYVHSDTLINIGFFDQNGVAGKATSVRLVQEGEDVPASGYFAEWMPYQVGQAKKHETQPLVANSHVAPGCEQFSIADIVANKSTLPPHQQRVIEEKVDLDEKRTKLKAFFDTPIFAGLAPAEQDRLCAQSEAMGGYSNILGERIAAF